MSGNAQWPKWPIYLGALLEFIGVMYGAEYAAKFIWEVPGHSVRILYMASFMVSFGLPMDEHIRVATRRAYVQLAATVFVLILLGLITSVMLGAVVSLPTMKDAGFFVMAVVNLLALALVFLPAYWFARKKLRGLDILMDRGT